MLELPKEERKPLRIGYLESSRDWSHAKDMVRGMWMILQQPVAEDYVLGSGVRTTVRQFIAKVVAKYGATVEYRGEEVNEKGYINGDLAIEVDPEFYRPHELTDLVGNPRKAREQLGWTSEYDIDKLIDEMILNSYEIVRNEK